MNAPTPLMIAIDRQLRAWRIRDESCPDYACAAFYGANVIRRQLSPIPEKDAMREALSALRDAGRVALCDYSASVLWQSAPRDVIDVREVVR